MKTKVLIFAVLISLSAGLYLLLKNDEQPKQKFEQKHFINFEQEAGTFSKERWKLEYYRLRDPKTGKIPDNIRTKELNFAKTLPGSYNRIKKGYDEIQNTKWQTRGPNFIGGRTRALNFDVRDENIWVAGGVSGGMWRSTDAGKTWVKTTEPDQLHSISCLAQDTRPGKEDNWYAGTGEYIGNSADISGDGIYKSTDNGKSWFLIPSTSTQNPQSIENPFDYVWEIVVDPTAPLSQDVVIAATLAWGIQRSTDGGNTWEVVLGKSNPSIFTEISVTTEGTFYAALGRQGGFGGGVSPDRGFYRSTDGVNWTDITPEFDAGAFWRFEIGIAPSDESQVYFFGYTPGAGKLTFNRRGDSLWHSFWKYTYISGDGSGEGGSWENRSEYLPKPDNVRLQMNAQSSYNMVVAVHPEDPNIVFLGATSVYRSTDGFSSHENWQLIGGYCPFGDDCEYAYRYPNHHADEHVFLFWPNDPNKFITASDGGVHITHDVMADTVEWHSLNEGYITTQFYTVAVDHGTEGSEEIIGGTQDNGTLYSAENDLQLPWTYPSGGDGLSVIIEDGGNVYYASQNSSTSPSRVRMWRILMDENGENLIKQRIDPAGAKDIIWNHPMVLDPNNQSRMYTGAGRMVWRNNDLSEIPFENSTDSISQNWDSLQYTRTEPDEGTHPYGGMITALDVSTNPANIVYYGTIDGHVYRIDNAHEGDPEPVEITGSQFARGFVNCIKIDPDDASEVFIVFSSYRTLSIFRSTNSGETWEAVSGNLEENENGGGGGPAVNWLDIVPVNGKKLYLAGTSTGLYSTAYLNGMGTVWQQEGTKEIGNMVVKMVDTRAKDSYAAVGTHGAGIFSAYVNELPPVPGKPELLAPVNGFGGVTYSIDLKWQDQNDAGMYQLQIASDSEFNNIIHQEDGVRGTEFNYANPEQGLKKFYWRVAAISAGGLSEYSDVRTFVTAVAAPELTYPENRADSIPLTISLKWNDSEDADHYHLQLAKNIFFSDMVIDTTGITGTSLDVELESFTRYYWKISAVNGGNEGLFGDAYRFTTLEVVSVDDYFTHYYPLEILSVYPNPADNNLALDVYVQDAGKFIVSLYDLNGNKVKTLHANRINGGKKYTFNFNVNDIPPGMYYLMININGFEEVNSVVIY